MHCADPCGGHGLEDGLGHIARSTIYAAFHLHVAKILADEVSKSHRHGTGIWIGRGNELRLCSNGVDSGPLSNEVRQDRIKIEKVLDEIYSRLVD